MKITTRTSQCVAPRSGTVFSVANGERINELEAWLKVLRRCAACQVHFDMWNDRASSFVSAQEAASMRAEVEQSRREQAEAEPAIEALIIKTRAEAPETLDAWISMHEACLPDDDGVQTRAWAALRAGATNRLYEFGRWPADHAQYVRVFGTEP